MYQNNLKSKDCLTQNFVTSIIANKKEIIKSNINKIKIRHDDYQDQND